LTGGVFTSAMAAGDRRLLNRAVAIEAALTVAIDSGVESRAIGILEHVLYVDLVMDDINVTCIES